MEHKQLLQEFEGYIDSVDSENKTFWATLHDVTNQQSYLEEMGEFDFSVFDSSDHVHIKEGYIFEWHIGDIIDENNIKIRSFSVFVFQKRNRKEQSIWKKKMVKVKKEARRMCRIIQKMSD